MNNITKIQLCLSFYDGLQKPLSRGQFAALKKLLSENGSTLELFEEEPEKAVELVAKALHRNLPSVEQLQSLLEAERMQMLLAKRKVWENNGIKVVGPTEPNYPQRLLSRTKMNSPLLFCQGNVDLLNQGGVAVVGNRDISTELQRYARREGQRIAENGFCLISGGSVGADAESMRGALRAKGGVISAVATLRGRTEPSPDAQQALVEGLRFVKICLYPPENKVAPWMAMERNALIYELSDMALVVEAKERKGGTWGGAMEQFRKNNKEAYPAVRIFCRAEKPHAEGISGLLEQGAQPWPTFHSDDQFKQFVLSGGDDGWKETSSHELLWAAEATTPYGLENTNELPSSSVNED